jgi:YVTN family beta-propeller protein
LIVANVTLKLILSIYEEDAKMLARIKISAIVLICSAFLTEAAWKRTDVSLLPEGNTINGVRPFAICTSGNKVFVANMGNDSVSIIDLDQENQVTNMEVGRVPWGICAAGDKVFVANRGSNNVSIIDLTQGNQVTNVNVGESPIGICAAGDKIFVARRGSSICIRFLWRRN